MQLYLSLNFKKLFHFMGKLINSNKIKRRKKIKILKNNKTKI